MSSQPEPIRPASSSLCPLARDRDGNPIAPPDGMVAWRVRRKTGGRPRTQLGADKQPMQLSPTYSILDVQDILAPGAYLLDAVDVKGELLGLTVPISVGDSRNADGDHESDDEDDVAPTLPTTGSETRLVLEANVRATQMAFQHNQKTLELALRTAETLRDGVQSLASAQADWIKSMASARGFFRNAPTLQLPPPTEPTKTGDPDDGEDDEDDDEGDDDGDAPPRSALDAVVEQLAPLIPVIVPQVVTMCMNAFQGSGDEVSKRVKLDLADYFNWNRIAKKRNAAAAEIAAEAAHAQPPASPPIGDPVAFLKALPPELVAKLMQVKGTFSDDDQRKLMQLLLALRAEDIPALVAHIQPMSVDEIAAFLRAQISSAAA